jgi:hypothetical protein
LRRRETVSLQPARSSTSSGNNTFHHVFLHRLVSKLLS